MSEASFPGVSTPVSSANIKAAPGIQPRLGDTAQEQVKVTRELKAQLDELIPLMKELTGLKETVIHMETTLAKKADELLTYFRSDYYFERMGRTIWADQGGMYDKPSVKTPK